MKVLEEPLVSIIVITYNSSKYVLETLESAKVQTYQNIELIVSDDCSTDNTVQICRNWIAENKDRFVRTKLITIEKNTGIAPNCNRGLNNAKGEWVKFIAGDDILLDNCIFTLMNFCFENSNCRILFGRMFILKNSVITKDEVLDFYSMSQKDQFIKVLNGSGIPSQACFIKSDIFKEFGGYNEEFKYIEDGPFWFKISENGIYFHFVNEFVVKYRLHENNISGSKRNSRFINEKFYNDQKRIYREILYQKLLYYKQYKTILHLNNLLAINDLIILFGNKVNIISMILELLIFKHTYHKFSRFLKKTYNLIY